MCLYSLLSGKNPDKEGIIMVKGTNRRVIVVKSPDPALFEQAIFLLKEDAAQTATPHELLEEAQRAAERYSAGRLPAVRGRVRGIVWALAGAAPVALAWLASVFFR